MIYSYIIYIRSYVLRIIKNVSYKVRDTNIYFRYDVQDIIIYTDIRYDIYNIIYYVYMISY